MSSRASRSRASPYSRIVSRSRYRLTRPPPRHRQDRLVDETSDQIEDGVPFEPVARAHGLGGPDPEASGEDAEPAPEDLFLLAEHLVTPFNRRGAGPDDATTAPRPSTSGSDHRDDRGGHPRSWTRGEPRRARSPTAARRDVDRCRARWQRSSVSAKSGDGATPRSISKLTASPTATGVAEVRSSGTGVSSGATTTIDSPGTPSRWRLVQSARTPSLCETIAVPVPRHTLTRCSQLSSTSRSRRSRRWVSSELSIPTHHAVRGPAESEPAPEPRDPGCPRRPAPPTRRHADSRAS